MSGRQEVEPGAARRPGDWLKDLEVYWHPRVGVMLLLGFSAGLPFLLIFSTLSFWLSEAGVSRATIGFFFWVGMTFSLKVVWAPVIDRLPLPWLTGRMGKRRSWMLLAQLGIAAGLLAIAAIDPGYEGGPPPDSTTVTLVAMAALLVAFSSATQDVALDAYRIEAVEIERQGAMAAAYQLGYRIALLVAGAGALYAASFLSWPDAYRIMAALMLVGIVTVLCIAEPEHKVDDATLAQERKLVEHLPGDPKARWTRLQAWFLVAVVAPFTDFLRRNGHMAWVILLFVLVYRLSDITMGVMANPFYNDLGFSKVEVANISKIYGAILSIAGAFLGGLLVKRYGLMRPLLLGAILVATTNLLFAWLALQGPDLTFLTLTISADNLAGGIAGTVFIAYLSSLVNRSYTATQYALFSSLFTLGGKFIGGFSGVVVDSEGYVFFFLYAAALGIPAILLVLYLMAREARRRKVEGAAGSAEAGQ